MANTTIQAFKDSEMRLRKLQSNTTSFSANWRVVSQGFQLDVSIGNEYISRTISWFELHDTAVAEVSSLLQQTEDWCFRALDFTPPTDEEPADDTAPTT